MTEEHNYTLTAESDMLTEVCACGHTNGTITIKAADKTYDGVAVEVVITKTGSLENADITITYTKDGEAFMGEPIETGTYTVTLAVTIEGYDVGTISTTFLILADTTDVDMTTDNSGQTTVIYDLRGRRVEKATKGIYIVGGRKVVLK